MSLLLGQHFPNFQAESTKGRIVFDEYVSDSQWAVLFSHPLDFTPVCTTELAELAKRFGEFTKRGVKVLCLSLSPLEDHRIWAKDIMHYAGLDGDELPFPIIADPEAKLAKSLGIMDEQATNKYKQPVTCRAVVVIGPEQPDPTLVEQPVKRACVVKLIQHYPATTGRNFPEILRCIDSLQITEGTVLGTPANWQPGEKVIVTHLVPDEEAKDLFPDVEIKPVPSEKLYMKFTLQPATGIADSADHENSHTPASSQSSHPHEAEDQEQRRL